MISNNGSSITIFDYGDDSYTPLFKTEEILALESFEPFTITITFLLYGDRYHFYEGQDIAPNRQYWVMEQAIEAEYQGCPRLGDLNGDTGFNILDVVIFANCLLAQNCADLENACAADLNGDGGYNVLDIVQLANCVLAETCESLS